MHMIDGQGAVSTMPTPEAVGAVVGYFAAAGIVPPTQLTGDFLNALMLEIKNVIDGVTGEPLSKSGDNAQLYRAIIAAVFSGQVSVGEVTTAHKSLVMGSTASAVFGINSAVLASVNGRASADKSVCIAADIHPDDIPSGVITGDGSAILACNTTGNWIGPIVDGIGSCAFASEDPLVFGDNSMVAASVLSTVGPDNDRCAIISCELSSVDGTGIDPVVSVLLASRWCNLGLGANSGAARQYVVAGGYNVSTATAPSWRLESQGGNMRSTNAHTTSGLDYAELFENGDGKPHAPGRLLTRRGAKAHLAQPGDRILGPVSVTPTVIGGDDGIAWAGRHRRDRWGAIVWEEVEVEHEKEDPEQAAAYKAERSRLHAAIRAAIAAGDLAESKSLTEELAALVRPATIKVSETVRQMVVDPAWDPTREQVTRRDRPADWTVVGLLGQVRIAVAKGVVEGDALMPGVDGVGVKATREYLMDGVVEGGARVEVMQVLEPYTEADGFGVALCLVR